MAMLAFQVMVFLNPDGKGWNPSGEASFDETVKPSAEFDRVDRNVYYKYRFQGTEKQGNALSHVAMEVVELSALSEKPEFQTSTLTVTPRGATTPETAAPASLLYRAGTEHSAAEAGAASIRKMIAVLPAGYAARIYWDGEPMEDFILGEAD